MLIDRDLRILAGHGRVQAAKKLKKQEVPCLYVENLSDAEKRAYVLADNKLALNATWDEDLLAQELAAISALADQIDVTLTGFDIAELDSLIESAAPAEDGDPDDDVLPEDAAPRCQLGDIWQLGQHRLICADSSDCDKVSALMNGQKAQMVFTDPPYNLRIAGNVTSTKKHREFAQASGEMTEAEFVEFLRSAFTNLTAHSVDGAIHFVCMDWRHMGEIHQAADGIYEELKNLITWVKPTGAMGTFYRSRHELIFAYKHGAAPHTNSFELGQHGRYRTNVWEYRSANRDEQDMHPTVKPVQMIADAIKDVSARGQIVLDLFGGSGSTLIAAEKTGRRGFLSELDPRYCDVILARYEVYAKDEAILVHRDGEKVDLALAA